MKKDAWIIIANSSVARIFKAESNSSLHEIETLCHPESRLKGTELTSDKAGRCIERGSVGRTCTEPHINPKQNEFEHFAEQVAKYLEHAHSQNKFKALYIGASPHFLGLLRQHLKDPVTQTVAAEIHKDWTSLTESELKEHLSDFLASK